MGPARTLIRVGDRTLPSEDGEDLLEVLQRAGVSIETACGGTASCGQCRVEILQGAASLRPMRSQEREHIGDDPRARLACQAKLCSPAEVVLRVSSIVD